MLIDAATLRSFAATLADDTESRPAEVREWCLRQTEPVEVPESGLAIFSDAGIIVMDERICYAECIGFPHGARIYGATLPLRVDGMVYAIRDRYCECGASPVLPGVGR